LKTPTLKQSVDFSDSPQIYSLKTSSKHELQVVPETSIKSGSGEKNKPDVSQSSEENVAAHEADEAAPPLLSPRMITKQEV